MQIADLLKNPELALQVIAGGASFVSGIGALWWKLSKLAARFHLDQENIKSELIRFSATHLETSKALVQLATKLDEREKDVIRLEGAFEATRRDQIHLITGMQQAVGSLDAVWRTLQTLHPDAVPRRASDGRK